MSLRRALVAAACRPNLRPSSSKTTVSLPRLHAPFSTSIAASAKSRKSSDDVPLIPTTDPLIVSLQNATDTELIDAILAGPRPVRAGSKSRFGPIPPTTSSGRRYVSPYDLDWKSSIDPGLAFMTLRKRPLYGRFLNYIRPQLAVVYDALRASGIHQLFASDILIQNNNHGVVRELLQLDAEGNKRLRSSLTVSLYEHIRKDLQSGRLRSLSGKSNAVIAQALIAEERIDLLEDIWDEMAVTLEWSKANSWPFLQVMSCLTQNGRVDKALRYLLRLVDTQVIPKSLIYGNSDPTHPQAKTLLVQSTIVRLLLQNRMYDRLEGAADDMLATMESFAIAPYLHDLILEVFRTNMLGQKRDQIAWAGGFILRYARLTNAPPLPRSIIDTCLNLSPPHVGARWYLSLPEEHDSPSALHITRLAHLRPDMEMMTFLLRDVSKLPEAEFIGQRGHFLSALTRARHTRAVAAMYGLWQDTFQLTPNLVVPIVRLLTETPTSAREHDDLVKKIITSFRTYSATSAPESPLAPLSLIHVRLLRSSAKNDVDQNMSDTVAQIRQFSGSPEIKRYIEDVLKEHPAEGFALVTFLREQADFEFELPTQALIDACLFGDWKALDELESYAKISNSGESRPSGSSSITDFQGKLIHVLRQIKNDSLRAVVQNLSTLHAGAETIPMRIYRRIFLRAVSKREWNLALESWLRAHEQYRDVDGVQGLRSLGKNLLGEVRSVIQNGSRDDAEHLIGVTRQSLWTDFGARFREIKLEDAQWDQEALDIEESSRAGVQRLWELTESVVAEGPKESRAEEPVVAYA